MDIAGKTLDILLRQISPKRVLDHLEQRAKRVWETDSPGSRQEELFIDFAETTLSGYSEDEQKMLYGQWERAGNGWGEETVKAESFLSALIQYGQEVLTMVQGVPHCRDGKALSWREVYLRLGQDTVVCPYLAWQDAHDGVDRKDFTWPAILNVCDNELSHILEKGIAENHNHICGGTFSFQITWCRAMNYPKEICSELENFKGSDLHYRVGRGTGDNALELKDQLEIAALIRTILFRAIHRYAFREAPDLGGNGGGEPCGGRDIEKKRSAFSGEEAFLNEYVLAFSKKNVLYDRVDCLQKGGGAWLVYPDDPSFCLDYALDDGLLCQCLDPHARVLAGERHFLYQCTLHCLEQGTRSDGRQNKFTSFEQELFYLYLLLKTNFRSEMIQANGQTGFENFRRYQNRKDDAWDGNPYFWEAARLAINYRLSTEHIVSLEGRLMPKAEKSKKVGEMYRNAEKIYRFDRAKRFADCTDAEAVDPANYEFDMESDADKFADLPYFFVYHFAKLPDDRKLDPKAFAEVECRHRKHRQNVREAAEGLIEAMKGTPYLRNRVRGIDGCASEVGCRAEVFASAYRYIDAMQHKWNMEQDGILPSSPMRISTTYHAGEDFLDIADGLRAIDEAVSFLRLGAGSRIGHALAMGVSPEEHYRWKHYEIVTTKQDRLDDLVWLLYRVRELGGQMEGELESRLRNEAYGLFREIYGEAVDRNGWNCGLQDYYSSMHLRGDDPSLYAENKKFVDKCIDNKEFDGYLFDRHAAILAEYRQNACIAGLYYYYHFGAAEGIRGRQTITCKVGKAYINLMRQAQDVMQRYVDKKRITVECNPSSNVLIGTFGKYELHPIFRFNNRKLGGKGCGGGTQLQVCVNTDDLGVFDTSLEFEYALLAQTLLAQEDDSARPVYCARDVMEYLDDLREMGLRAVFPKNVER